MQSLTDLVSKFIDVRSRRIMLEKEADELKSGPELELKKAILQLMADQGVKSANIEGLGRVVSRDTSHFEIFDVEALTFMMFKNMVAAAQAGRPLTDALLLQKRVHAENLREMLDTMQVEPDTIGVRAVVKTDLSFSKS